jgi:hypothetical protein
LRQCSSCGKLPVGRTLMKKTVLVGLVALGFSGFGLVACGGGDSSGEETGDGDGDGEGRTNIPCVAAEEGDTTCFNDTDCPAVEDGSYRATAKDCLLNECLNQDDEAQCVSDCLVEELGVTAECSICYGTSASCSAENCLSDCIADGDSPECAACQEESGCTPSFFSCSGLAIPE